MEAVLGAALGGVAGAALVLDRERRVALATPEAEELLGMRIPKDILATRLLCGTSAPAKRPLADALDSGHPVQAVIPMPGRGHQGRTLRVRDEHEAAPPR